jgi:hypothetical protein
MLHQMTMYTAFTSGSCLIALALAGGGIPEGGAVSFCDIGAVKKQEEAALAFELE